MTGTMAPPTAADLELKTRQRRMWASGDYGEVAREVVPHLGAVLVEACGVGPGDRVLDAATGTGNAAIPAARAGAQVVASDLTPELLAEGSRTAAAEGLSIDWQEGDVERLPYPDASFDVVLSCIGAMFAPHHERTADELVRVCRPGGTIGLLNWTPDGFVGRLFAALKPFVPPSPPGAQPAPRWGDRGHVDALFADRVTDARHRVADLRVTRFTTGEEFRDFFRDKYGPTLAAYRATDGDAGRRAALDRAMVGLGADALEAGEMRWEYLVYTARRAD